MNIKNVLKNRTVKNAGWIIGGGVANKLLAFIVYGPNVDIRKIRLWLFLPMIIDNMRKSHPFPRFRNIKGDLLINTDSFAAIDAFIVMPIHITMSKCVKLSIL